MGDAAEIEQGGAVRMLKDLFAGAAGGIAQVLIGIVFLFGIVFCFVSFMGDRLLWIKVTCVIAVSDILSAALFPIAGGISECNACSEDSKGVDAIRVTDLVHEYTNNG